MASKVGMMTVGSAVVGVGMAVIQSGFEFNMS